jgi:Uri superfamily endonuclease
MLGAVLVQGSRPRECGLAQQVAALFGRAIPGFGASDCGCEGHPFYSPRFDLPKRTGTS